MKALNLDKNSWHCKVATFGGLNIDKQWGGKIPDTDICTYTRKFLKGAIGYILLTAVATILAVSLVRAIIGIGFSIAYWTFLVGDDFLDVLGVMLIIIGLVCGSGFGCYWLFDKYKESRPYKASKPPGIVTEMYLSWKHKYCLKINFNGEKTE